MMLEMKTRRMVFFPTKEKKLTVPSIGSTIQRYESLLLFINFSSIAAALALAPAGTSSSPKKSCVG